MHAMNAFLSLLTVGLLAAPLAHAQDDPRSKAVMDRLVAKNKGYTSFEADFTSRLVNKAGKLDVKQEGTVKVKGKKFHLVLDKNTVISDGVTLWTYNKEANEVSLNAAAEMDQELDPSKLFTMYETGFKSQFVSEAPDARPWTQGRTCAARTIRPGPARCTPERAPLHDGGRQASGHRRPARRSALHHPADDAGAYAGGRRAPGGRRARRRPPPA